MPNPLPAKFYILVLSGLIIANILVYRAVLASRILEVRVLGVGESVAALVTAPDGKTLLVDTGPDASILRALGGALPDWQRSIDAIVLTGASANSVGGVPDITRRYRIGELIRFGAQGSRITEEAPPPPARRA